MKALTASREYLGEHRRMIIGRSLAAALLGSVPVPILDDWLVSAVRRSTIQRIADARGVDIDDDAIKAIADGKESPPKLTELAGGGLALRLISRRWKKLLIFLFAARRAQAASKNFAVATLFDHYCARRHVGFGLDGESGRELRALIDQSRKDTPGGLSRELFRKGLVTAAKASLKAPLHAADLLSRGRLTKLLKAESDVEAVTEVDEALERQLAKEDSFLGRSVTAIELQLATEQNPYIDDLIDRFDLLLAEKREEE